MPRKRVASQSPEDRTKPPKQICHGQRGRLSLCEARELIVKQQDAKRRDTCSRSEQLVRAVNPSYSSCKNDTTSTPTKQPGLRSTTTASPADKPRVPPIALTPTDNRCTPLECLNARTKALLEVPLPPTFQTLLDTFGALQSYHNLCRLRNDRCVWASVQASVEELTGRRITLKQLQHLSALVPDIVELETCKQFCADTKSSMVQLCVVIKEGPLPTTVAGQMTSPRSAVKHLSRTHVQHLQKIHVQACLADVVLRDFLQRQSSSSAVATTTTAMHTPKCSGAAISGPLPSSAATLSAKGSRSLAEAAARISQQLASGSLADEVAIVLEDEDTAARVQQHIGELLAMLQQHSGDTAATHVGAENRPGDGATAMGSSPPVSLLQWPWCPALPEAPLPSVAPTPNRRRLSGGLPPPSPAPTPSATRRSSGSHAASRLQQYARQRRLSTDRLPSFAEAMAAEEVTPCSGKTAPTTDEQVLASLPANLRRRSAEGALPIPLSLLKAMRDKETHDRVNNSPAMQEARNETHLRVLLPKAFDCIRTLFADKPQGKTADQVVQALLRSDTTGMTRDTAEQLLQSLAQHLPDWLSISERALPPEQAAVLMDAQRTFVTVQPGQDLSLLRRKLVKVAGPCRRLSLGNGPSAKLLPNAQL